MRLTPSGVIVAVLALVSPLRAQTTFTVNSVNDVDDATCDVTHCSLREAINAANANTGPDIIAFNITGAGPHTIQPTAGLPAVTDAVTIDGYTQSGASVNTNGPNQGTNAVLQIEVDGSNSGGAGFLRIASTGGGSTVKGLVINRFGPGITVQSSGNTIEGNFIGTDVGGSTARPNTGVAGVHIENAANNTIGGSAAAARNILSGNAGEGIFINGASASGNLVHGNLIGTTATGTATLGNGGQGVFIDNASNNTVGGPTAPDRNIISGNVETGVWIFPGATGNSIQGNYVGTDVTGGVALGNGFGIRLTQAVSNTVGGTAAGAGNVISGNGVGLQINQTGAPGNFVQGNFIGTDATGMQDLGNSGNGIELELGASDNTIGGTLAGARNIISGNDNTGIMIGGVGGASSNLLQGNYIGTDVTGAGSLGNSQHGVSVIGSANTIGGTAAGADNLIAFNGAVGVHIESGTGNAILSNSIFANGAAGIDLLPGGVTANDPGDGDTGPNDLQNFPIVAAAYKGSTIFEGTLNSTANTTFTIQFFSNSSCDASGHGQGATFLGSTAATTDGSGDAVFSASVGGTLPTGTVVTATATDDNNSTSEFSQCATVADFTVAASPGTFTVNRGQAANYTVTVGADGGTFAGDVVLACSNLPLQALCAFSPSTVSPGATTATSTLTVSTTDPDTPTGQVVFTIAGTSGSIQHSTTTSITVVDFTIAVTPGNATVTRGGDASYTVSIEPDGGTFGDQVSLSCSGLPVQASCSFSPVNVTPGSGGATSILTVSTTDPDTPTGAVTFTVAGSGGSLSHTDTPMLTVVDFDVASSPASVAVVRGEDATYTVTVSSDGGSFGDDVALACSNLPAQSSCSFSPASVTPGSGSATSTLTVSTTDPDTPTGLADFIITGTSGSLAHSTASMLLVTDFRVAVSPNTATVIRGKAIDYTVTVSSVGGTFDDPISLSCAGLPTQAACSFSPNTVTPGGASATSTMTVSTTNPDTPAGVTDFTVDGTSGSLQASATVTLVVSDFTVTFVPDSVAVIRGDTATYTIEIGPDEGAFVDPVALSCDNLPAQTTCTFSDSTLIPGVDTVTSTLKVSTVAPGTAVGAVAFSVKGTSGSIEHVADATLDVTIDFTIAITPGSQTVAGGGSASYAVDISPLGHFDSEITLSCGGVPAIASCSFSPAAVTPNDQDVTSSLTISTTTAAASFVTLPRTQGGREHSWPLLLLAVGLSGIALTGLMWPGGNPRVRRALLKFALVMVVASAAVLANGCGESTAPPGPQPQTFSISVTGTSGSISHSVTITLVVQ